MKAILEFNLPEDKSEFEDACKGSEYKLVLSEFDQELRAALRYDTFPEWETGTVDSIRERLWQLINDRNLNLD